MPKTTPKEERPERPLRSSFPTLRGQILTYNGKEWAILNFTGYGFPASHSYEVFCKVMPDAVNYRQRGLLMPDILFCAPSTAS